MKTLSRSMNWTCAATALACAPLSEAAPPPTANDPVTDKPNVIFVLADDLGYGDLGYTGSPYAHTPNLDRFAAESLQFTSAYAPSPQCSPTRAAILTGQYPARLHITTWIGGQKTDQYKGMTLPRQRRSLRGDVFTAAEHFRSVGYTTAQVGKWHLGSDPNEPARVGFDHTIGFSSGAGPGHGDDWFGPYPKVKDLDGPSDEYITDRLTTEAVSFIENHRDEPFFLMFQHYDPHAPLVAPEDRVQRYVDMGRPKAKGPMNATYLAMIESIDIGFGRLMEAIDEAGLTDRTIVVFFSDNGAVSWHGRNAPYRGEKKTFYEGGIRVPLFVRVPGMTKPGSVCDVPVNGVDFLPTFVELTGGDVSAIAAPLDGVSLMPLLRGGDALDREAMYWHHPALSRHYAEIPPQGVVREGPWKLIDYYGDHRSDELYHIVNDPSEEYDLAGEYPERVQQMREMLQEHLEAVDAQRVSMLN